MNQNIQTKKILGFFILLSILLLTNSCTKTSLYPHDALAPPNSNDYATVHILRQWALTHSLNTLPIKFNGTNLLKIKNSSYTTVRIKPDTYEVVASFHSTKPHTTTSTETYRTSHETSYGTSRVNKVKKHRSNKSSKKMANKNSVEKKSNSKDKQANSKYRNTGAAKKNKKNKITKTSETKITTGSNTVDYIIENRKGYRGKDRHIHEETYTSTNTTTYGTGSIEVEMIAGEVYYILVRADTIGGGDKFVTTSINLLDKTLGEELREELKFIAAVQEK